MKTRSTIDTHGSGIAQVTMANQPPNLLILPEGRSRVAKICTLAHPRTTNPNRYLFDPEKGICEFTKVAAPKPTFRSWLISRAEPARKTFAIGDAEENQADPDIEQENDRPISDGYVLENAQLLIATPIDYLFLILPCFASPSAADSPSRKRLFLSADDLIEKLSEKSKHFNQILSHANTRQAMEARMEAVCDTVDAGDEIMYRLSEEKLLSELVLKAENMVAKGLPSTIEERFVRKALETPVIGLTREESSVSEANASQNATPMSESTSETADSQTSTTTSESKASASSAATEMTVPDEPVSPSDPTSLYHLLRLRTAISYMLSSYIPPSISTTLETLLSSSQSPIDFVPLERRLAAIAKLRAEALASRSLGDFSRKRSMYEEDDATETRAEKKRKHEEEEKRKKAGESRGIRDLKKVDTKGMKKMSDFFGKAAAKKK